jgi:hypothetical protein
MRRPALASLPALLVACAPDAAPVREDARSASSAPLQQPTGPPPATHAVPGIGFDPAQVQVGDTVAGLRVAQREVHRAPDGEWVGMVRFAGSVVVRGQTVAHPDYPDVAEPCFAVERAGAARLPRWAGDVRRAWFCFANPTLALARLGRPSTPRAAVLTLTDFTINYAPSDVVNSARLVHADSVRVLAPGTPTG